MTGTLGQLFDPGALAIVVLGTMLATAARCGWQDVWCAAKALIGAGAAKFDELLRELTDTLGLTVFLITHDLDTLYAICDRVAVLADKKVIAVGTIAQLLKSRHPWIEEYFNGPRARAATQTHDRAKAMDKPQAKGA